MKKLLFISLIALFMLTSCERPLSSAAFAAPLPESGTAMPTDEVVVEASTETPTATSTPTATGTATVTATSTATVTSTWPPTFTPLPVNTDTATPDIVSVLSTELAASVTPVSTPSISLVASSCILDSFPANERFTVPVKVDKLVNQKWEFDPRTALRVPGDVTHPELPIDASLVGCDFIADGRLSGIGEFSEVYAIGADSTRYLDADGILRGYEFSVEAIPLSWNLDILEDKIHPAMVLYRARDKRVNQRQNGYDWDIFVYTLKGNTWTYPKGTTIDLGKLNFCDFAEPRKINVAGLNIDPAGAFNASIGAEGCYTAAKLNGKWEVWQKAKDNIVYATVEAWLMPSTWTVDQVNTWVSQQH